MTLKASLILLSQKTSSIQVQAQLAASRAEIFQIWLTNKLSAAHTEIAPPVINWAPTVVAAARPAAATFAPAPVAALASMNDFVGNFGHALYDFLCPASLLRS